MHTHQALRGDVAGVDDHWWHWTCAWVSNLVPGVLVDGPNLADTSLICCPVHLVQDESGCDLLDLEETRGNDEHEAFASAVTIVELNGRIHDGQVALVTIAMFLKGLAVERVATPVRVDHPLDPGL